MGLIMQEVENCDYEENHLDGLQVHHNPFAEFPLDEREFDRYEVTHYRYDAETKVMDVAQNDYSLISRKIIFSL